MDRQERRGPLGRGWIRHRAGLALIDTGQVVQGAGSDPMVACGGFSHNTTGRCTEAQCGFIHWKRGSGGGIARDPGGSGMFVGCAGGLGAALPDPKMSPDGSGGFSNE